MACARSASPGGEPLLRKNLEVLIAQLAQLRTVEGTPPELTLTTNGSLLARKAQALREAGLQRVTVSLDGLDDAVFRSMNDVDYPVADVLAGIEAARAAGLGPIKVNMVVKRGTNEHEIVPMARHFRGSGIVLRFIEYMDVGGTNGWRMDEVLPSAQVRRDLIAAEFPLVPREAATPPARQRSAGPMRTARAKSASSAASRRPSAATATAPGSPPKASSTSACSPATATTCARCCAAAPATPSSPPPSATSGRAAHGPLFGAARHLAGRCFPRRQAGGDELHRGVMGRRMRTAGRKSRKNFAKDAKEPRNPLMVFFCDFCDFCAISAPSASGNPHPDPV
jgi:hypothetical protein